MAKGNPGEQSRFWTQGQTDLSHALERIRNAAKEDKELQFTAIWHHVYNVNRLRQAYHALKRDAAAEVDGETWRNYGETLEGNRSRGKTPNKIKAIHAESARNWDRPVSARGSLRWGQSRFCSAIFTFPRVFSGIPRERLPWKNASKT